LQQHYVLACARDVFDLDPEYHGHDWSEVEEPLLERIGSTIAPRSGSRQTSDAALVGSPATSATGQNGPPLYVVVEKILGANEDLPADWPTLGTSGYDFINVVNGLFVDPDGEEPMTHFYHDWTGDDTPLGEVIYEKKHQILRDALSSELHMLGRQLDRLAQKNRWSRDFTQNTLRYVLRQVISFFPVYRSYISDDGVHLSDRTCVDAAARQAMRRSPTVSRSLFRFVRDMLLLKYREPSSEEDRAEQRRFAGKFQQVTSPVMAKGVEDTAFYVYNRLMSLNEVGGDPSRFGVKPEAVHAFNLNRQEKWPWSLSPLSTHDTKRSEDVRARLNVLSELPLEWEECVCRWSRLNEAHRAVVDEEPAPDANEEYLIYQTLISAWPLEPYSPEEYVQFIERLQTYVMKALHEAKVHTSWISPNEPYDEAVRQFVDRILDEQRSAQFLSELRGFQRRVSHFGLLNSLSQTLLKIVSPGAPDTYQGTELWDFSLVDPDNRRPVDYTRRQEMLRELDEASMPRRKLACDLIRNKEDGRVKLYVTAQALRLRRDHPGLFSTGEYLPVEAAGAMREHVFSFARRHGDEIAVAVVPRLVTRLAAGPEGLPLGGVWQDTRLSLPEVDRRMHWRNIFTGRDVSELRLSEVFADFPVALLMALQ
jgi:(1->4)-alpha-D-glucan 1-alpha-D-glucosylmutase